jgi:ribosomal protein S20
MNEPQWEKSLEKCEALRDSAVQLVDSHRKKGVIKSDLYSLRSILQSAIRKMELMYIDSDAYISMNSLYSEVDSAFNTDQLLSDNVDEE